MSTNTYSLCTPKSETDRGAARAFAPGGGGGFALVADRSLPKDAPPRSLELFTSTKAPTGDAPAGYTLFADARLVVASPWSKRALYIALAVALLLHLAVLTPFMLRPAPSPEDVRRLGMEQGAPENLNVSLISEADLKRLSSDPFRQEAPPTPAPADASAPATEPQETPEPPQKEPEKPQEAPAKEASAAETAAPDQKADDNKSPPFDPNSFIAQASEQFGLQLKQAVKQSEARHEEARHVAHQGGNVKSFRPGATHLGKSDEWERKVIWALSATKPMGNGKWGSAVVTFVVSDSGQVQGLRLIKSSGDNWLDQGALLAVRQARMPAPPQGLPAGDRMFNIEYISLPN